MTMKECSAFPKAPASMEPHHQIVLCHIQDTHWGGGYPSAEVQSVYSTARVDWAIIYLTARPLLRRPMLGKIYLCMRVCVCVRVKMYTYLKKSQCLQSMILLFASFNVSVFKYKNIKTSSGFMILKSEISKIWNSNRLTLAKNKIILRRIYAFSNLYIFILSDLVPVFPNLHKLRKQNME